MHLTNLLKAQMIQAFNFDKDTIEATTHRILKKHARTADTHN